MAKTTRLAVLYELRAALDAAEKELTDADREVSLATTRRTRAMEALVLLRARIAEHKRKLAAEQADAARPAEDVS